MIAIGLAAAACILLQLYGRHWNDFNSREIGVMSPKWLADHNTQHP